MNRRQLIKRGLFGGVILAGAGLVVWPPSRTFAPSSTKFLSARAAAVLGAIASRVTLEIAPPTVIVERIDASLEQVRPEVRRDLDQLLLLFDNALAGLFLDGHLRPFSALPAEAQDDVLRAWRDSRLDLRRSGYQVLRKLCLTACYSDRATHLAIGYAGPRPTGGMNYDDSKAGT